MPTLNPKPHALPEIEASPQRWLALTDAAPDETCVACRAGVPVEVHARPLILTPHALRSVIEASPQRWLAALPCAGALP